MNLRPVMFGDTMEILDKFKMSPKNDYIEPQVDIDIFTGKKRRYHIIDGHARVLGYMPGTTEFISNQPTTIWYFPN